MTTCDINLTDFKHFTKSMKPGGTSSADHRDTGIVAI